jgi:hypothetical protein
MIATINAYKKGRSLGIPLNLVKKVKRARVGQTFVIPLARAMTVGQNYTAAGLAAMLGTGWTARRVASKLNTLGRPESRDPSGVRIFERPISGRYSMTAAMRAAMIDPTI